MPHPPLEAGHSLRIYDRPHWRDALWFLWGGLAIVTGTGMLIERASVEEMLFAVGAVLLFSALPVLKVFFLLRRQTLAEISRTGIKLFDERGAGLHRRSSTAKADRQWGEIRRLVLWHQTEWQGGIRYQATRLSVEPRDDMPTTTSPPPAAELKPVAGSPLNERRIQALQMTEVVRQAFGNLHREGIPDHVSDDLVRHSVAFSASGRRRIAAAIDEIGVRVEFLDARSPGRLRPIPPRRRKDRSPLGIRSTLRLKCSGVVHFVASRAERNRHFALHTLVPYRPTKPCCGVPPK